MCIYTYHGKRGTVKELCEHFGLNYNSVKSRMRRGLSFEDAMSSPNMKERMVTVNGLTMSLSDHCKYLGINYPTVLARIRNGIPVEEALTAPLKFSTASNLCIYHGEEYRGITRLCRIKGVPYQTVRSYIRKGMTIEEAVDKALENKRSRS